MMSEPLPQKADCVIFSEDTYMPAKLPYVNQPGSITKILQKVQVAQTPDRFTIDFLSTKLGFKGGNYRQFIPLAKKLGLLKSDGSPTELYKKYRNSSTAKAAMAEAVRNAYSAAFERNEYANSLTKDQFKGLVVEITGLDAGNRVVQLICQTFESLKSLADFEAKLPAEKEEKPAERPLEEGNGSQEEQRQRSRSDFGLNLAYTINLVLPKTDDAAVFNAIFRSLRENLLRK